MGRQALHDLVDKIPEEGVSAAQRVLEYLAASPAYRAAWSARVDDEPVTEADAAAIERAREDVNAGRVSSHKDFLREFGLG